MSEIDLPEPESAFKNIPDETMRKAVKSFLKEHYLIVDFFALVPEAKYSVRVADETPAGKLFEGMVANFNQYDKLVYPKGVSYHFKGFSNP